MQSLFIFFMHNSLTHARSWDDGFHGLGVIFRIIDFFWETCIWLHFKVFGLQYVIPIFNFVHVFLLDERSGRCFTHNMTARALVPAQSTEFLGCDNWHLKRQSPSSLYTSSMARHGSRSTSRHNLEAARIDFLWRPIPLKNPRLSFKFITTLVRTLFQVEYRVACNYNHSYREYFCNTMHAPWPNFGEIHAASCGSSWP